MKPTSLTTKLNFKIITVVLVLMFMVMAYNHWLLMREANDKNVKLMMMITDFLVEKKPAGSFSEMAARRGAENQPIDDQVLAIHQELQPMLNNILLPADTIKFGFYSQQHNSIVAIGPYDDLSMLTRFKSERMTKIYETDTDQLFEINHSFIWHGADAIAYVRLIRVNGVVVGHAFAVVNQDVVKAAIWKQTIKSFFGVFLMLLVCVAVFRELFVTLKTNLQLFAEGIVDGHSSEIHSEIVEFAPILQYIREQTDKMVRLDRMNIIGEMAAGIAHEIRNPMTTVRGLLQFMGNKPQFTDYRNDFLLMIDEIDRANSIITEFLSLAKNRSMEFHEMNLNDILHDIFPLLQADSIRNKSTIELELEAISNAKLDSNTIRQLILNMVRNALDAMPEGGVVRIQTKMVESKILLSIADNGSGISPEIIDKVGTPFFTTKETGTGLGLAICYRIIQRHGATVTIKSQPGKGTIFTIVFQSI